MDHSSIHEFSRISIGMSCPPLSQVWDPLVSTSWERPLAEPAPSTDSLTHSPILHCLPLSRNDEQDELERGSTEEEEETKERKERRKVKKDQYHLNHNEHLHLSINPWWFQGLSHSLISSPKPNSWFSPCMDAMWSLVGSPSSPNPNSRSSRSSLAQSCHESLKFLFNAILWIFARNLMIGQIHLFCLETRLSETPSMILVS